MKKKTVITILWTLIAAIAVASIVCLIVLPQWKGYFLAGSGGFLILNLLISLFFIHNNYRDKR